MKDLQYFYNFEDPQGWNDILKDKKKGNSLYFVSGFLNCPNLPLGGEIIKETYGFDFVSFVPGEGKLSNPTIGWKNCLKGEYSKFARKCRNRGGVFKCCFSG